MTTALTTTPSNESDASMQQALSHCDRCGALAKVRIILINGFDLVFCGHHDREYATGLSASTKIADVTQL